MTPDSGIASRPSGSIAWRTRVVRTFVAVVGAALLFAALEGALAFLLGHPGLLPEGAVPVFRRYYRTHEWLNLQLHPQYARYDPELTYTLRPGRFRFRAREFDNLFEVNSRGLRDDEESLAGPEIIVLGDSHAMGWGVEQKDTFASRLAAATGRRVLNAGIPSYGTARELGLLARLDTSRLTVLVVQYCSNDYRENRAWVDGGGALEIKGAAEYEQLSRGHREAVAYRFGKHVLGLARVLLERLRDGEEAIRFPPLDDPGPENEAAVFADVLASSAVDLSGVRIVVLELNANAANDRLFLDRLQAELARDDLPASVRNLVTVDVSDALDAGHYYVLDSHMTPAGHDVVTELLVHVLEN